MSDITLQGLPKCDKFMFSCHLDTAEVTVLTWGRGGDAKWKVTHILKIKKHKYK